jgi:hypothetical protein
MAITVLKGGYWMIKQKRIAVLGLCIIFVCILAGVRAIKVEAAGDYTNPELKVTEVEDISVYNDNYTVNDITINNAIYDNQDGHHIYKFTLEEDGYVSLLITCRRVEKITKKYGTSNSSSAADATVSATIYRDKRLLYPVTPVISAKGRVKGESASKIALDKGTYYVAVIVDKYTNITSNSGASETYCYGTAELIVYYQPLISYEQYRPSMVGKENELKLEEDFKGVLTATNPKDYYKFTLNDKALVKINYMYSSVNSAKFTLYSSEREVLLSKTFSGGSIWYNVEKYLEPGVYYCSLETTKQYDSGTTSILINPTVYSLTLEQRNRSKNSYVEVATIDDPMEIRYVLGKLTNSELTSAKWNKGKQITDTLKFGVNKLGYYTVRVTDQYGNMFMQSIKITDCDREAPLIPAIETCKADTFVISGTAEKDSFISVYVNNKLYTCVTNSKGSYNCTLPSKIIKGSFIEVTAADISGNVSEKAGVLVE